MTLHLKSTDPSEMSATLKLLKQNSHIGVIVRGESGSGKSTLLRMLKDYSPDDTYLTDASIHIFEGSIRDNVLLGREISFSLVRVLKKIFCDDGRLTNPDLIVSRSSLSTGEAQRISFLRDVIVSKGKILLMDEPTSALDNSSESRVLEMLVEERKEFGIAGLVIATHSNYLETVLAGMSVEHLLN